MSACIESILYLIGWYLTVARKVVLPFWTDECLIKVLGTIDCFWQRVESHFDSRITEERMATQTAPSRWRCARSGFSPFSICDFLWFTKRRCGLPALSIVYYMNKFIFILNAEQGELWKSHSAVWFSKRLWLRLFTRMRSSRRYPR